MKIGPGNEFDSFKDIMERHFLDVEEAEIDAHVNACLRNLKALKLSSSDLLKNMIHYFTEIFWTAELKTTQKPLHVSRDYALKIFAKVFSNEVAGLKGTGVRKVDFIMFITGIIDHPYMSAFISDKLRLIAASDVPVLITGETGTGKELHAKAVHYLSPRLKKKFMPINCAGIPESLLESELFGIVKGAATGVQPKEGILNAVEGGTLFLDEIGDMPLPTQAKILRVLQSKKFNKVGDPKKEFTFNGRVIAATNRDLKSEIKESPPKFRPDLYYRLNVMPIELSPFRNLSEDEKKTAILNKLRHIIYSKTDEPGNLHMLNVLSGDGHVMGFNDYGEPTEYYDDSYISQEALDILAGYSFPGNYRELDNIIRRAYVLSGQGEIKVLTLIKEVKELTEEIPQEIGKEEIDVNKIMLKDIISRAEEIKANIIRKKIDSVYRSGIDLKGALAVEGVTNDIDYQNFRNKIERILGKGELRLIRKSNKK